MNELRTLILGGFAAATASAFAQSGPPISVVVDGEPIQFPYQQPQESEGRVLVPLRGVFEKLGASVDWNPADQTITAKKKQIRVKLAIGQLDASVNDRPVHMDIAATLVGGTTMVPLRFVSEALGAYVTWNAAAHEVDIKRSTDYDLPVRRDHDHDRDRPAPPVRRPVPPPPSVGILPANTVIPFTLNIRLSSRISQPGDMFTATLVTDGSHHYFALPAGTTAYGSVAYVRHQQGPNPGLIELHFDHLQLPNGRNLPFVGKLVGLDDGSVIRRPDGTMVARSTERNDHVMYSGSGSGVGVVLGIKLPNGIAHVDLGRVFDQAKGDRPRRIVQPHDVELRPGTQLGVRLYQDLTVPLR